MRKKRDNKHLAKSRVYRIFFWIAATCFVGAVVYCFLYADFLQVKNITGMQQDEMSAEIVEYIEAGNAGSWLGIQKSNLILINADKLSRAMTDEYPRIKDVTIKKIFPNTLNVAIEKHDTITLLCDGSEVDSRRTCVELEGGAIMRRANLSDDRYQKNDTFIVAIKDVDAIASHQKNEKESVILPVMHIETLKFLYQNFPFEFDAELVGEPQMLFLGSNHARLTTADGWSVLVDMSHEPRLTVAVVKSFLDQVDSVTPISNIHEIDARILGKIFYRTNESLEVVQSVQDDKEDQEEVGEEKRN